MVKLRNSIVTNPAGNYMLKVNNRNTRTRCEICSNLTLKTQNVLVSLLLTLNIFYTSSSVSVVKFERLIAGWETSVNYI